MEATLIEEDESESKSKRSWPRRNSLTLPITVYFTAVDESTL
jgi:hypothetical protein